MTPFLRQEHLFRRDSLIAGEKIEFLDGEKTYSRVGRYGAEGKALLAAENEAVQFLFMGEADEGEAVSIAHVGQGQVQLTLAGTGRVGQKIGAGEDGKIHPVGDGSSQVQTAMGISLDDWSDGDLTEIEVVGVQ